MRVQMFLQFVCNKNDNKLEITFVRSSLDLGNEIELENHLSTFIDIYHFKIPFLPRVSFEII